MSWSPWNAIAYVKSIWRRVYQEEEEEVSSDDGEEEEVSSDDAEEWASAMSLESQDTYPGGAGTRETVLHQ